MIIKIKISLDPNMQKFFIFLLFIKVVFNKLYIYDSKSVAEIDTDTFTDVEFYLTEDKGAYASFWDNRNKSWTDPSPIAGMNTANFQPISYSYNQSAINPMTTQPQSQSVPMNMAQGTGWERFGLIEAKPASNLTPNPYPLGNGPLLEMKVTDETKKPNGGTQNKDEQTEKTKKTTSKSTTKRTKNSAPGIALLPTIAAVALISIVL